MGLPTVAMGLLGLLMPPQQRRCWCFLAAHQSLAVTGRPGAGADCTPSLAYDDRDYYWHVGRILTADRPQSSVVGAGAWRRIDSLCRVCALQSAVSGFRPRGEVAVAAHGRATGVITGATGVFVIPAVPGYRRWAFVATSWCRPRVVVHPFHRRWRLASPCTMAGMMMHGYCRRWRCCRRCSACGWDSGSARVLARSAFVRAFCCSAGAGDRADRPGMAGLNPLAAGNVLHIVLTGVLVDL